MKRIMGAGLAVAVLGATAALHAFAAEKPAKELVTGRIRCLYAFVAEPNVGDKAREFETNHIVNKGNPAILVEEGSGAVYFLIGKNGDSVRPKIEDLIGLKANVQGPVYRKDGVNVLEVLVASEAM